MSGQQGFFGPERDTLEDERARLLEDRKQPGGTVCGACEQHTQEYRRILGASQAAGLIRLYRVSPGGGWQHVNRFGLSFNQRGDWSKLRFWGLIEEQPKDEEDRVTRTSGIWRITPKGAAFVRCEILVHKYCWMYDGEPTGWPVDEDWSIRDALAKKFDYDELMGWA